MNWLPGKNGGFKAGIDLVIVLDQAPKLFSLHIDKAAFFPDIGSLLKHLPDTSLLTYCRDCPATPEPHNSNRKNYELRSAWRSAMLSIGAE